MKCKSCGSEVNLVEVLEKRMSDYSAAIQRGDLEEAERIAPKGKPRTYGDVAPKHSEAEIQRRVGIVNKARGVV